MLRFKRASIFTRIIIIVLLIYAVTTLVRLRSRINEAETLRQELTQQVSDQTAENEKTRHEIENSDDDEVIEDVARDKLGLVKQDEEVYYAG